MRSRPRGWKLETVKSFSKIRVMKSVQGDGPVAWTISVLFECFELDFCSVRFDFDVFIYGRYIYIVLKKI